MDLINAAKKCDFELAFTLITSKYPVNGRDTDNATALYWSAIRGHAHMCDVLVQSGCEVNTRVTWGSTALHAAADRGHTDCVEVLLRSGIEVDSQNNRGDTALHIASYRGHTEIARMLLQAGAMHGVLNSQGKTATEEAMAGNHTEILRLLAAGKDGTLPQPGLTSNLQPPRQFQQVMQNSSVTSQTNVNSSLFNTSPSQRNSSSSLMDTSHRVSSSATQHTQHLPQQILSGIGEQRNIVQSSPSEHEEKHERDGQQFQRTDNRYTVYRLCGQGNDHNVTMVTKQIDNEPDQMVPSETNGLTSLTTEEAVSDYFMSSSSDTTSERRPRNEDSESTVFSFPLQNRKLQRVSGRPLRSSTGNVGDVTLYNAMETYAASLHENMMKTNIKLEKANQTVELLLQQNKALKSHCSTSRTDLDRMTRESQHVRQNGVQIQTPQGSNAIRHPLNAGEVQIRRTQPQKLKPCYILSNSHFNVLLRSLFGQQRTETISLDTFYQKSKLAVKGAFLRRWSVEPLDVPGREWVPGVDYVILGGAPSYWMGKVGEETKCFLAFQIKHAKTKFKYQLQVKWNQRSSPYQPRGTRPNSGQFMVDLCEGHPNVVPVLHSYDASIERFQKFLMQMAQDLSVEIHPPAFTSFRVTPVYSMSLEYVDKSEDIPIIMQQYSDVVSFSMHALYHMLSVLCFLKEKHIVHRNIRAGTIFLDSHLRPILGGFELARNLLGDKSQPLAYSDRQDILSGKECMWPPELVDAYTRGPRKPETTFLNVLYAASDLFMLGKTIQALVSKKCLETRNQVQQDDVTSDLLPPNFIELMTVLGKCTRDSPNLRISTNEALATIGVLLLSPSPKEFESKDSTLYSCQARLMKLLAIREGQSNPRHNQELIDDDEIGTADVKIETEAHILTSIPTDELWETFQKLLSSSSDSL